MTVTSAETVSGHPRLREHAAALDSADRACDAVSRLFATPEPHPGVFALLCNELALLDAGAGADALTRRMPTSSPSASSCCSPPGSRRTSPRARRAARPIT